MDEPPLKTYKVLATMSTDLYAYIEAEDEEEAWQIAKEMSGDEFEEEDHSGDWNIDQVIEVAEHGEQNV